MVEFALYINLNKYNRWCNMNKLLDRKSIRLKDYDYSNAGYYFITICTQNSNNLFGEIADNKMVLNKAGQMIERWVKELEIKFMNMKVDKFIIMPNHFHIIITIESTEHEGGHIDPPLQLNVGVDLCVNPSPSLSHIIQWFKTMTTNDYIKGVKDNVYPPFDKRIWQRNYYEHIIRQETEYIKIYEYIENNPLKWAEDKYYQTNDSTI